MNDDPAPAGVLAAELAALRASAGNPSFRKMAERSGCISHTTLHEAVKGTRFPSWETTREFVKACGENEVPWRRRWEDLKGVTPKSEPEHLVVAAPPPTAAPKRLDRRYALILAGSVIVVLIAVATFVVPGMLPGGAQAGDIGARIPGDNTKFVGDVTLPDGADLHLRQTELKVWEIENAGSVPWHERYLRRMDLPAAPGTCRTPDRVLIGDTAPGEHVMISVPVTAAPAPGRCWIGWKMVDANGEEFFTTRRPVYVLVDVVP